MACIAFLKQYFPNSKKECCFRQELWYNEITANSEKTEKKDELF